MYKAVNDGVAISLNSDKIVTYHEMGYKIYKCTEVEITDVEAEAAEAKKEHTIPINAETMVL